MSLLRVTLALIALIALFSASSQAGKTADVAVESCLQDLNLSAVACACIGRRAEEELNEKQQKHLCWEIAGKYFPLIRVKTFDLVISHKNDQERYAFLV